MRTCTFLFSMLVDPDWLDDCVRRTVRGKRMRPDVAAFLFREDSELARIRAGLEDGSWRPWGFKLIFLRDPKPRVIARAPVADRVVHAAVGRLIEQVYEPLLYDADFSCPRGRGTHRAVLRIHELALRHRCAVHLDLRSYFPSIDPVLVEAELRRRIRDERFLGVLDRILVSGRGMYDLRSVRRFARIDADWPPRGRGLPIGAYTSQVIAAHVVPLRLDAFVKRALRVPGYVRYVDDLFLFDASPRRLREARDAIAEFVVTELGLRLKRPRAPVLSTTQPLHALGWSVGPTGVAPLARRGPQLRRVVADLTRDRTGADPRARLAGLLADDLAGLVR